MHLWKHVISESGTFARRDSQHPSSRYLGNWVFAEMLTGRVLFQGDESNSPYEQLKSVFRVLATPGEPEVGDIIKSFNEGSFNLTSEILLAYNRFSKYAPFDLSEAMSDGLKGLGSWGLDLLSRMLNMNFRERISIESALCHRYFSANALEEVEFEFRLVRNYSLRVGYNNKFAPKDRMMILSAANGLSCLQHLPNHPNIISIDGWFNEDVAGKRSGFQVITRYKWTRTLRTYRQRRRDMGEIHRVMLQLLSGVAHCHAHGVVHGDLRPENVTVDHTTGDLQLSEFDMASRMPPLDLDIHIGRPENFLYYQAPELLHGDTANPAASDIWSVGCIFAEMLLGAKVLFRDSKSEQIATIFSSPNLPSETLPLLSRMLAMNPADRFSAVDCLFDSFFKSLKCRSLDGITH